MKDKALLLYDIKVNPKEIKVRKNCSIKLSFKLGLELPKGSFLTFRLRGGRNNKNDWYYLQPYDLKHRGYAYLNIEENNNILPLLITGKELSVKYLILESKGIKKNTEITFTLTNTLAQSIIEDNKKIEILVNQAGKNAILSQHNPEIKIISGVFDHINLIAPSTVTIGQNFECILRIEDKFNNLVQDFSDKLNIYLTPLRDDKEIFCSKKIQLENESFYKITDLMINQSGIYRVQAIHNGVSYRSNPISCELKEKSQKKLYWGYIHGHTKKSDGMRTLQEYFENLIKSGLDFGTSTEHDRLYETSDMDFNEIKETVTSYNDRGDFTSFFGYEYGTWYTGYGDICIYHRENDIPIFRSELNKFNSTPKLIKNLKKYSDQVLMIGHHTALRPGYRNWDYFDNSLEKLVEIYSTWGNQEYSFSEGNPLPPRYKFFGYGKYARKRGAILGKEGCYVKDALLRGYKLGFVAGGDDHFGAFPSGHIDIDNGIYPSGIMAIWTNDLNKEELWSALNNRRCYGTTGPRVILKFWLNRFFMGEIIKLDDNENLRKERTIKLIIISPLKTKKIELIRNNEIIYEKSVNKTYIELEFRDDSVFEEISLNHTKKLEKFVYYYPRLFLDNTNMAWASPIWIIENK